MNDNRTSVSSNRWGELIELQPQQLIQIALLGAGIGVVAWVIALVVKHIVLVPLFCGDPTTGLCVGADNTAGAIASVLAAFVGLLGLVRLSVYRPLLIVVAVAIGLWGLGSLLSDLLWFESLGWTVLLYAIMYVLFAWIVRPRSFVVTLLLVLIAVILVRLPVL